MNCSKPLVGSTTRSKNVRVAQLLISIAVILDFGHLPVNAQSPSSSRNDLSQFLVDLKNNPTDEVLREKIIKLALTINPKPPVPDEASIAAGKGKTIFAHAESKEDLMAAAAAFEKASLLAPWVPEYYFNQGLAREKAAQYDDAIVSLHFYLMAAPTASDVNDVRGRIEGIRYEKERAAQKAIEEARRSKEAQDAQREAEERAKITGLWKVVGTSGCWRYRFQLSGDQLNLTHACPGSEHKLSDVGHGILIGRTFRGSFTENNDFNISGTSCLSTKFSGSISTNNDRIQVQIEYRANPSLTKSNRETLLRFSPRALDCGPDDYTLEKE